MLTIGLSALALFFAQSVNPVPAKSQTAIPSPQRIVEIIERKDANEQLRLAKVFKLMERLDPQKGDKPRSYCEEFDDAKFHEAKLDLSGTHAVIQITSNWCETLFVVILQRSPNGWVHLSTIPLSMRYGFRPDISMAALVSPNTEEIVIRKQVVDSGTGIRQENFSVLKLVRGQIRTVLDEPERIDFSIPVIAGGKPNNSALRQENTFRIVRQEGASGNSQILEHQIIKRGSSEVAHWRLFVWQPEIQIFRAFPIASPESIDKSVPPK